MKQERIQMGIIDWHDFVVVESIEFANDENGELPTPMTLEEVTSRSKISAIEQDIIKHENEVEMEMDKEEAPLVEKVEAETPMMIVKKWKRPEERIPAERNSTKFVVSPISGELIPVDEMSEHMRISLIDPKYKEQKERMFAKIRETTLAKYDEISRNIVGFARARPDIFGTTEEEVSNAVKAEIEKPKLVLWNGHTNSIGLTANQATSQNIGGEDQNDAAKNLLCHVPPSSTPGMPSVPPVPPLSGLALNLPRVPHNTVYSGPASGGIPVLPLPTSLQFVPVSVPQPFVPLPVPSPAMPMMLPPLLHQGVLPPPPPPPEDYPPRLPDEPSPKRQKVDGSALIPEDQFLAQHPGPVCICVSVPNVDEGILKRKVLEIAVQSLSETVGSLKEKIAAEIQLPANKQKLRGQPGFLKDNMSLAYYNVGGGEMLALSLRKRGGRRK